MGRGRKERPVRGLGPKLGRVEETQGGELG